jgi:hypothetical protein
MWWRIKICYLTCTAVQTEFIPYKNNINTKIRSSGWNSVFRSKNRQ